MSNLKLSTVARTRTVDAWQAPDASPDVRRLFGSHDDLPLLTAPTDVVVTTPSMNMANVLTLSRAALVGLGAAVFACGLLAANAAHSLTVTGPTFAHAASTEAPAPAAPVAHADPVPIAAAAEIHETPAPATIQVPAPVKITAHKAPAAHKASAAPSAKPQAAPAPVTKTPVRKPWVDPFAE
jgi:hypothetical protein